MEQLVEIIIFMVVRRSVTQLAEQEQPNLKVLFAVERIITAI